MDIQGNGIKVADSNPTSTYSNIKKKEKLNSLRDFKIHSNTISPNTSVIRGKKVQKDNLVDPQSNSRKELYRNHAHYKKNSYNEQTERPSFNYSELKRKLPSDRGERHRTPQSGTFACNKNKSISFKKNLKIDPPNNISTTAKQKIKN